MIDKIILTDNKFDIQIFNRNLEKLFMDIIDSIEKRDIDSIKNYVASDVYYKLNMMVNTYKEKNITRTFKNVNIESIDIENVDITDNFITIDTIVKVKEYGIGIIVDVIYSSKLMVKFPNGTIICNDNV